MRQKRSRPDRPRQPPMRALRCLALLLGGLVLAGPATAAGPPVRLALVVGIARYATFGPLPACQASADRVTQALRDAGMEVIERRDASLGEFAGALAVLTRRLGAAPGSTAVIYVCGYAVEFNQRSFLLPGPATLDTPSAAITQGLLATSVVDAVLRGEAGAGLVAIDAFAPAAPGQPLPAATLAGLAERAGGRLAVLGSGSTAGGAAASTPLAVALAEALPKAADLPALVAEVRQQLAGAPSTELLASDPGPAGARLDTRPPQATAPPAPSAPAHQSAAPPPATSQALVGASQAPVGASPPATAQAPVGASLPATSQAPAGASLPATSQSAVGASPPPAAAPATQPSGVQRATAPALPAAPEEAAMTAMDRRRVQIGLASLGYYDGRIDGLFGPETRAAIRKYQSEIGSEATGVITGTEAARLFAAGR